MTAGFRVGSCLGVVLVTVEWAGGGSWVWYRLFFERRLVVLGWLPPLGAVGFGKLDSHP